jgi:acyl-CoA synthetase (AMP-forming)/AMP-acid ligase II
MERLGANPANSCPLTPLGFLERAATVFGDCPSVVYHDTVFNWSQTFRRSLRLASALVMSLGISRGDIVSPQSDPLVFCGVRIFACPGHMIRGN